MFLAPQSIEQELAAIPRNQLRMPSSFTGDEALLCFRYLIYSSETQERKLTDWKQRDCELGKYIVALGKSEGESYLLPGLWMHSMMDILNPFTPNVERGTIERSLAPFNGMKKYEAIEASFQNFHTTNKNVAEVVDKHLGHDPEKFFNAALAYNILERQMDKYVKTTILNNIAINN